MKFAKAKHIALGFLCIMMLGGCAGGNGDGAETTQTAQTAAFHPADFGMPWSEALEYQYLGLNLKLPESMRAAMESKDLMMYGDEMVTDDETAIEYAQLYWSYLNDEQKEAELTDYDQELTQWMNDIQRVGVIGVYHKDLIDTLDEITKCDQHTELAVSPDGNYYYYLSLSSAAAEEWKEMVQQVECTISEMVPYQAGASAFAVPRVETDHVGNFSTTDIYGNPVDQDIFKEYDLTLVNLFTTWCSPCVKELPELEKLRNDLGEAYNINVVGVVMDTVDENYNAIEETAEKAKLLAEKTGLTFPVLIPESTAMNGRLIGVDSFPETFFVDKNGNIVGESYLGSGSYEDWKQVVEKELQNLER